jgi:FAD/FMN-containing dehydrogenase
MRDGRRTWIESWGGKGAFAEVLVGELLEPLAKHASLSRGLGRAYGDAALPAFESDPVLVTTRANRLLEFDPVSGRVRAEAGLALGELLWILVRKGWFVPVVPGTQFVTLGGMVAADVHGKNHHVAGTFGRHVLELKMMTADGLVRRCSSSLEPDLFRATLGGMGWTGHILEVTFQAERIPSAWIVEEQRQAQDLEELLGLLREASTTHPFTVAWLDALAQGRRLGRGVIWRGRWAEKDEAPKELPEVRRQWAVPWRLPSGLLCDGTVRLFNELVFRRASRSWSRRLVSFEQFFFPLDSILHWNRIYGRRGFTQFQCVLPERERPGVVRSFLEVATRLGGSSFLCVLKDCGPEGEGILSFPRDGISIALDLPVRPQIVALVDRFGQATAEAGGRIYLAKDGFLTAQRFRELEPRIGAFLELRRRYDPAGRIRSAQLVRLVPEEEGRA